MKIINKKIFRQLNKNEKNIFIHITTTNINFQFMKKIFDKYNVDEKDYIDGGYYIVFENEADKETYKQEQSKAIELKNIYDILNSKNAPKDVFNEMLTWNTINKSPYSASFYNSYNIDWDSKPEGSLRISDHWNFMSKGKMHCKLNTTKEYLQNTWILGKFINGEYVEVKRF